MSPEFDYEYGIDDETRRKQRENLSKRSAAGMEKRYAELNRSALEEAEASMAPPVITVPQCHVCQSERRLWIERQLLRGRSYAAIANSLPEEILSGGSTRKIDRRSIAHHSKEHMPLDSAVVRAVMEEEADLLGQNWEEGVRGAFTNRGALNTLIRKAFDDAMNNVTTVEPRDLIQMVKLYNEMETSGATAATEEAKTAIRIFMEAIQNVVTDMLDAEKAEELKRAIVDEVKRLRSRDEIEIEVEHNLRTLPRVSRDPYAEVTG